MRVLVTASDPAPLAALLAAEGAHPISVPTITIHPLAGGALDAALQRAESYDWIVLTSPNGVRAALDRLDALGRPLPRRPRWAAVGPRTRAALEARGALVEHVPEDRRAAAIPAGLGELRGARVLLLRAAAAGRDLPWLLEGRGARVDDVAAYETCEAPEPSRAPLAAALERGIDGVVFTSGSTVRGFLRLAGDVSALSPARVVCIGPATARAARAAGIPDARVAADRTPEALLAALRAEAPRARA